MAGKSIVVPLSWMVRGGGGLTRSSGGLDNKAKLSPFTYTKQEMGSAVSGSLCVLRMISENIVRSFPSENLFFFCGAIFKGSTYCEGFVRAHVWVWFI